MIKLSLLFPGQGSQYIGMGKLLCEESSTAKLVFEEADDTLKFGVRKLCFEGSQVELTKTENTQPAILTVSRAMFMTYMERVGVEPLFMAGHSLGEISALTCAGVINFRDALRIVRRRGELMQQAAGFTQGTMAAIIGISKEVVESECKNSSMGEKTAVVSNYNSSEQTVISGNEEVVSRICKRLECLGGRVVPLKVSAPFHCSLMQPIAGLFEEELMKYNYSQPKYSIVSNVNAQPYNDLFSVVPNLVSQLYKPVQWQNTMEYLEKNDVNFAIEMGPQNVLKNLVYKNTTKIKAFSYDKEEDKVELSKILSNHTLVNKKDNFNMTVLTKCLAIAVSTRNSNLDIYEYNKGVIEPYKKIEKTFNELKKNNSEPSIEQIKEAILMLVSVFKTKKVPIQEQSERFNQLLRETNANGIIHDFVINRIKM